MNGLALRGACPISRCESLPMRAASFAKSAAVQPAVDLVPVDFAQLDGFNADDHLAAFAVFARTAAAICGELPSLRPAHPPSPALAAVCREALADPPCDSETARLFFRRNFHPFRVMPRGRAPAAAGLVTGYFEPVVAGALTPSAEFVSPVLARPDDL